MTVIDVFTSKKDNGTVMFDSKEDVSDSESETVSVKLYTEFLMPRVSYETLLVKRGCLVSDMIDKIREIYHLEQNTNEYVLIRLDVPHQLGFNLVNDVEYGPDTLWVLRQTGHLLDHSLNIFESYTDPVTNVVHQAFCDSTSRLYISLREKYENAQSESVDLEHDEEEEEENEEELQEVDEQNDSFQNRDDQKVLRKSKKISLTRKPSRKDQFIDQKSAIMWIDSDDLIDLPTLTSEVIMQTLKERFEKGRIYTYVGGILVVINPYKAFPIYNPTYAFQYRNYQYGQSAPHIFALADMAYNQMLNDEKSPSIVISGESGSGKTDSCKHIIEYLSFVSPQSREFGNKFSPLSSSTILEAFGNASTTQNKNSSRFGKFTKIHYSFGGIIQGSSIKSFLLEKSRIVHPSPGERNYHIFYSMLSGIPEKLKSKLYLEGPYNFRYLGGSFASDAEDILRYTIVMRFIDKLGMPSSYKLTIHKVISAILHLGQIEFEETERKNTTETIISNPEYVSRVADLLSLDEASLTRTLITTTQIIKDDRFTLQMSKKMAEVNRDSLAKAIYSNMFEWLIAKINDQMGSLAPDRSVKSTNKSISFLDLFGFENNATNGYEQFCINYANEYIQHYLMEHIFKEQQDEYLAQGIKWNMISYLDNRHCLLLINGKIPAGLISLIDEESSLSIGTDNSMLAKFTSRLSSHPCFSFSQLTPTFFSINHYAGCITYSIEGFKAKNQDYVKHDIMMLVRSSHLIPLREMMGSDPLALKHWMLLKQCIYNASEMANLISNLEKDSIDQRLKRRMTILYRLLTIDSNISSEITKDELCSVEEKKKKMFASTVPNNNNNNNKMKQSVKSNFQKTQQSVISQFQNSLLELMETLKKSHPFFIRCIRPNEFQRPLWFDDALVMKQLTYTGLLSTVKIRQAGYDCRMTYEKFFQIFGVIMDKVDKNSIISHLHGLGFNMCTISLGSTKIFMKSSTYRILHEHQNKLIEKTLKDVEKYISKYSFNLRIFVRYYPVLLWAKSVLEVKKSMKIQASSDFGEKIKKNRAACLENQNSFDLISPESSSSPNILRSESSSFIPSISSSLILSDSKDEENTTIQSNLTLNLSSSAEVHEASTISPSKSHDISVSSAPLPKIDREDEEEKQKSNVSLEGSLKEDNSLVIHDKSVLPSLPNEAYISSAKSDLGTIGPEFVIQSGSDLDEDSTERQFDRRSDAIYKPMRGPKGHSKDDLSKSFEETSDSGLKINKSTSDTEKPLTDSSEIAKDLPSSVSTSNNTTSSSSVSMENRISNNSESTVEIVQPASKFRFSSMRPSKKNPVYEPTNTLASNTPMNYGSLQMQNQSKQSSSSTLKKGGASIKSMFKKFSNSSHASPSNLISVTASMPSFSESTCTSQPIISVNSTLNPRINLVGDSGQELEISIQKMLATLMLEIHRCSTLISNNESQESKYYDCYSRTISNFIATFCRDFKGVTFVKEHLIYEYFDRSLASVLKAPNFEKLSMNNDKRGNFKQDFQRHVLSQFILHSSPQISTSPSVSTLTKEKKVRSSASSISLVDGFRSMMKRKKTDLVVNGHVLSLVNESAANYSCDHCGANLYDSTYYKCCRCHMVYHKKCVDSPAACTSKPPSQDSTKIFGGHLQALSPPPNFEVPSILCMLVNEIEKRALKIVGIYRQSGNKQQITNSVNMINCPEEGQHFDPESVGPHVLTAMVKQFLRTLSNPLLTPNECALLMKCTELQDPEQVASEAKRIFESIQQPCLSTVNFMMRHLARVYLNCEFNKMTAENLAIVFSPSFFKETKMDTSDSLKYMEKQNILLAIYIKSIAAEMEQTGDGDDSESVEEAPHNSGDAGRDGEVDQAKVTDVAT